MESSKLILILSVLCTISQATFLPNISSTSPKRDTPSENPQRSLQEHDENKIILYFNQNCDYPSGFKNDYRKDISLIRQGYDTYEIDISKEISLKKDAEVEIHFANPIKTFEHFFDSTYDKNMEFVEFIDFTYFDSSEVENMNHMFAGCKSLKSVNLSGLNTSSVTDISEIFSNNTSLEEIDLSSFDTSEVTLMINCFYGCKSLKSLNLSSFNTSKVKQMDRMFQECVSLTSIDLSSFDTSQVTDMNYMFGTCLSLISLDLSNFETHNLKISKYMFNECKSLKELNISKRK